MKLLQKFYYSNYFIFIIYILLVFFFYGLGVNLFKISLAPGDASIEGLPSKIFSAQGSVWNPFISSGTYQFMDPVNQSFYLPGILLMKLFPNAFGYNILLLLHYVFAGFFTFIFLKNISLNKISAFIGGLCFMFSGFLVSHLGHNTMVNAAIWFPLILYFIENYFKYNKLSSLIYGSISFSLSIFSGYPAVSFYSGMVIFMYIIFRIWFKDNNNSVRKLEQILNFAKCNLVIFLGGVLIASVQIIPILESLKYISRDKITYDFFSSFSFPVWTLPILIFPYIFGTHAPGLYNTLYYGPWNLTEMAGYVGILPLLFAIFAFIIFRKRNRQIWFWAFISLFGFLLVLGNSTLFYKVMFYIPIYNMFRVPARNWFEVNFAISILVAYAINYFTCEKYVLSKTQIVLIRRVVIVFLTVVMGLLGGIYSFHKIAPQITNIIDKGAFDRIITIQGLNSTLSELINRTLENTQITSPAIYIPLIIIFVSIIYLTLLLKFKNRKSIWVVVAIIIFIDLFSFGHFHDAAYSNFYELTSKENNEAYNYMKSSEKNLTNIRIVSLDMNPTALYPLLNITYGLNVINNYGPIWLKDYKVLTGFESNGISTNPSYLLKNCTVISMLANKYILTSDPDKKSFIKSIKFKNTIEQNQIIISSLSQSGWNYFSPSNINNGIVALKSKDGREVSLIQYQFNLEINTSYKISFQARTNGDLTQPLIVDFFTDQTYDNAEQEIHYDSSKLNSEFQKNSIVFESGISCPQSTNLRFYTLSSTPIEVKDIKLERINSSVKYWGVKADKQLEYSIYREKYVTKDGISIFENMNYLPRIRFISNIIEVKDFNAANDIMKNDYNFDPSITALVENYHGSKTLDNGKVISTDCSKNDKIKLSVDTGDNSYLILSDTWYPGWKAYVDGKETPIYKTNGVLRGILIQGKGKHQIEFVFKPKSFYIGGAISIGTLLLMIAFLLFDFRRRRKVITKEN